MKTLVSVIIPSYKRSSMLPRAIDSVLNQTYKNVEVIVVDDNDPNSDWRKKTESLMSRYDKNPKVKYICHPSNLNGSVARNTGINNSSGEFVTFLDDDDYYYPNKIELQCDFLLNHPEYQAVYCGWIRDGETVIPHLKGNLSFEILSGKQLIYTNTIMMYRDAAIECGGFDESFLRHQEASLLLNYFLNNNIIGVVSEPLLKFDVSDRSNETKDPIKYHQQMDHLLKTYLPKCLDDFSNKELSYIIVNRYKGVCLSYIKGKDYGNAFSLAKKLFKRFPFTFSINLISYSIKWILKKIIIRSHHR